jgi:hypothetical protein
VGAGDDQERRRDKDRDRQPNRHQSDRCLHHVGRAKAVIALPQGKGKSPHGEERDHADPDLAITARCRGNARPVASGLAIAPLDWDVAGAGSYSSRKPRWVTFSLV